MKIKIKLLYLSIKNNLLRLMFGRYFFETNDTTIEKIQSAQKDFKLGKPKVKTVVPDGVNVNIDPETNKMTVPSSEHGKIFNTIKDNLNELYKSNRFEK